jgi:hypothetical protein
VCIYVLYHYLMERLPYVALRYVATSSKLIACCAQNQCFQYLNCVLETLFISKVQKCNLKFFLVKETILHSIFLMNIQIMYIENEICEALNSMVELYG